MITMLNLTFILLGFSCVCYIGCHPARASENTDGVQDPGAQTEQDASLPREVASLRAELKELGEFVKSYISESHQLVKRSISRTVAFQAMITGPKATVTSNEAIKFNQVVLNIGNGYNKDTGVFTAPTAGVYYFSMNLAAGRGDMIEANIVKNDVTQVSAISDVRSSTEFKSWDQGSASVVLYLEPGDKVSVKVLYPHGSHNLNGFGIGKTSFGGYLITK